MHRIDVNILIGPITQDDITSFFGDNKGWVPDEDFRLLGPETTFPALLADLGIFRSRGDARRNGWDRPIPRGWTDLTIGKLHHRICILKRTP